MILVALSFILILVSNLFTAHHGPISFHGYAFTLGAILITPIWVIRDILHERCESFLIVVSLIAGIIAVFFTMGFEASAAAAMTYAWAYMVDTNVYIMGHWVGKWFARISSDAITIPTATFLYSHLRMGVWVWPHDQLFVRYLTLFAVYGILFSYERFVAYREKI